MDHLEKENAYWEPTLWLDEMKLELFGRRDVAYVTQRTPLTQ